MVLETKYFQNPTTLCSSSILTALLALAFILVHPVQRLQKGNEKFTETGRTVRFFGRRAECLMKIKFIFKDASNGIFIFFSRMFVYFLHAQQQPTTTINPRKHEFCIASAKAARRETLNASA